MIRERGFWNPLPRGGDSCDQCACVLLLTRYVKVSSPINSKTSLRAAVLHDSSQWVLPTAVRCWSSAAGGRPIGSCDHSPAFSLSQQACRARTTRATLVLLAERPGVWASGHAQGVPSALAACDLPATGGSGRGAGAGSSERGVGPSEGTRSLQAPGAHAAQLCARAPPRRHRQRARARGWLVRGTSRPH